MRMNGLLTTPLLGLCIACAAPKTTITEHHLASWESEIGYSQSVRVGPRIFVSGTVGAASDAKDMASQMKNAYARIHDTLAQHGATFQNVVKETIYTRDMDALIKCQDTRKQIYGGRLPAATWVQVQRLYEPEDLLEIEVEAILQG